MRLKRNAWSCPHTDREHAAKGLCAYCYAIKWQNENPEKVKKSLEKYTKSEKRKEYVNRPAYKAAKHAWYDKNKKEIRSKFILRTYNLTSAQYDNILNNQNNTCACGKIFAKDYDNTPHIDHNHKCCPQQAKSCGKCVRGLLCVRCNVVLGFLESEPHLLPKYLLDYLNVR